MPCSGIVASSEVPGARIKDLKNKGFLMIWLAFDQSTISRLQYSVQVANSYLLLHLAIKVAEV